MTTMKKSTLILCGAGERGNVYANYVLKKPWLGTFIAVAEPDEEKRKRFQEQHNIPNELAFESYEQLLEKPKMADAAVIAMQDNMHFIPAKMALEKKYNLLLEKPMAPTKEECIELGELAKKNNLIFMICHVLRYTPFYSKLKHLLDDGKIGELINIQAAENIGYWHFAHSYVRGNWGVKEKSSPMILAKCCHDMDILHWLAGDKCEEVASFGGLRYFKEENAPEGAATRCLDGCKYANTCEFYAPKFYLTEKTSWPASVISSDHSYKAREQALLTGPYGRCVYHCDNNVADHQIVNLKFANQVDVSFSVTAFSNEINRKITLNGTKGEIVGDFHSGEIVLKDFLTGTISEIHTNTGPDALGHGGGDGFLMQDFLDGLNGEKTNLLTNAADAVHSHLIAFAAEEARATDTIVSLK